MIYCASSKEHHTIVHCNSVEALRHSQTVGAVWSQLHATRMGLKHLLLFSLTCAVQKVTLSISQFASPVLPSMITFADVEFPLEPTTTQRLRAALLRPGCPSNKHPRRGCRAVALHPRGGYTGRSACCVAVCHDVVYWQDDKCNTWTTELTCIS